MNERGNSSDKKVLAGAAKSASLNVLLQAESASETDYITDSSWGSDRLPPSLVENLFSEEENSCDGNCVTAKFLRMRIAWLEKENLQMKEKLAQLEKLMLRCMTFGLNALVLRYVSRDMLGVVNVRLMLLYTTTLALSMNAIELAALSKTERTNWPQIINLSWCTVPIGVIIACCLTVIWTYILEVPDVSQMPYYTLCVMCYAVSVVMDLSSTATIILRKRCHFVKLRVFVSGVAELTKCLLTITLIIFVPQMGLLNFAVAQLAYGFLSAAVSHCYFAYYIKYHSKKDDDFPLKSVTGLLPSIASGKPAIDPEQTQLAVSIFKQSFLKQFLSEGERYVMTVFDVLSFGDQGIYDVVNNLGSMVTRFIFLPVEESGYLFFSQLLIRGQPLEEQKKDSMDLATNVLCCMMKVMILFGAVNLTFGYAFSYLALDLYGGTLLSNGVGPTLLRWYCLYVLVLAINGTSECFVFTTMSKAQVDRYNHKMLVFSGLFLLFALFLTKRYGSVGFILANCLNMTARIIHSLYYIHIYYKGSDYSPLTNIFPSPFVVLSMLISLWITVVSESLLCCDRGAVYRLAHIGVGGVCLLGVAMTIYMYETRTIYFIKEQYASRHKH